MASPHAAHPGFGTAKEMAERNDNAELATWLQATDGWTHPPSVMNPAVYSTEIDLLAC